MTFFSLIALAFGMMAAAADAAVPRPSFASIAVERRAARRRARGVAVVHAVVRVARPKKPLCQPIALRRIVAPLTGAATPRAPGLAG